MRTVSAALLIAMTVLPAAADELLYRNSRFEVAAPVPGRFATESVPQNDDGRSFRARDGAARIEIYGAGDALGGVAAYRDLLKETRAGTVDYEAGGENWFVLSGRGEDGIYYLRVERGETCAGDTVFGHWRIVYPETESDRIEPIIETYPKRLQVGCGALP